MFLALPVSFLLLQFALMTIVPARSAVVSYGVMVVAPLLAGAAAVWRGRREAAPARGGWFLVAVAVATWATGAFLNLWHELVLGQANEMYRDSMLAFNLAAVPLTFLLACEWQPTGRWLVRSIDALLALALGFAYFLFTWAMLTGHAPADETSVINMVWLFDAQNVFVAVGALFRWIAADEPSERQLFRSLAVYAVAYTVIVCTTHRRSRTRRRHQHQHQPRPRPASSCPSPATRGSAPPCGCSPARPGRRGPAHQVERDRVIGRA